MLKRGGSLHMLTEAGEIPVPARLVEVLVRAPTSRILFRVRANKIPDNSTDSAPGLLMARRGPARLSLTPRDAAPGVIWSTCLRRGAAP